MSDTNIKRLYELIEGNEEAIILLNQLVEERNIFLNASTYDELTKVYNRRVLRNNIDYDIVVMCDVDNFKKFNDSYGHSVGDSVLVHISSLLKSITRDGDFVCRYGGDEFVLILKRCSIDDAVSKLEIIKQQAMSLENFDFGITLSFGLTKYEEGKTLEEAIGEADIALFDSKEDGKNKISVYKKPEKGFIKVLKQDI